MTLFRCVPLHCLTFRAVYRRNFHADRVHQSSRLCQILLTQNTGAPNRQHVKICLALNVVDHKRTAGHAKWQNILHIKAAKDRMKNIVTSKYAYLIRKCAREGGADPKLNHRLAVLIEEGKKNNVPMSTMENALKKPSNKKMKQGSIEMLGPGGCMIIIDYETEEISATRHTLKYLCKKYGANILSGEGRWRALFERKGILSAVSQLSGEALNTEKALDDAILAGAEEVQMKQNENDINFLEFVCNESDLHQVKKELEQVYMLEDAYIGYIPITLKELVKDDMIATDSFLEELENMPEIVRIYENVQ